MSELKALSLALAVVASTGLLLGTFGFGAASADRGVSVSVADDDSAMVGYQASDRLAPVGERVALATVTNRLPGDVSVVSVSVDAGSFTVSDVSEPSLSPGTAAAIEGTVDCKPGETGTVEVSVTLEGDGVTAAISGETRSFELTCASLDGAAFNGAGNFEVESTGVSETDVVYWTQSKDGGLQRHELDGFDTSGKLQPQTGGQTGVVAVYFPAFDATFVHPNYDAANGTVSNWGQGTQDADRVEGRPGFDE